LSRPAAPGCPRAAVIGVVPGNGHGRSTGTVPFHPVTVPVAGLPRAEIGALD
jgi:hypothetical protein